MFKIPQAELWPTPPEVPRLTNKHLQQKLGEEGKKTGFYCYQHGDVTFTQSKSVWGWRGWQTKCQCSGVRNLEKWNKWIKQQTGGPWCHGTCIYILYIYNSLCQSKKKGYGVHISDPKAGWDPKALPRPSHLQGEGLLANGVIPPMPMLHHFNAYQTTWPTKKIWDLCSVNEKQGDISVHSRQPSGPTWV